jgi:hypothetical protein
VVERVGDLEDGKHSFVKDDCAPQVAGSQETVIEHAIVLPDGVAASDFDGLGIDPAPILCTPRANDMRDIFRLAYSPQCSL